jgi:hypothetical protein
VALRAAALFLYKNLKCFYMSEKFKKKAIFEVFRHIKLYNNLRTEKTV